MFDVGSEGSGIVEGGRTADVSVRCGLCGSRRRSDRRRGRSGSALASGGCALATFVLAGDLTDDLGVVLEDEPGRGAHGEHPVIQDIEHAVAKSQVRPHLGRQGVGDGGTFSQPGHQQSGFVDQLRFESAESFDLFGVAVRDRDIVVEFSRDRVDGVGRRGVIAAQVRKLGVLFVIDAVVEMPLQDRGELGRSTRARAIDVVGS